MYSYSRKHHYKHIALIILGVVLIFYFSYHAINGERGILAYLKLSQQVNKVQNELEDYRAERINAEHKVNLLRSESLDLDLLDEQARKTLGFAKDNEVIYFLDKEF